MTDHAPIRAYGFGTSVRLSYPDAVERTRAALKQQGFGVLTEIDVKQTVNDKGGETSTVEAMDPEAAPGLVGDNNPAIAEVARDAQVRLRQAIDAIGHERADRNLRLTAGNASCSHSGS